MPIKPTLHIEQEKWVEPEPRTTWAVRAIYRYSHYNAYEIYVARFFTEKAALRHKRRLANILVENFFSHLYAPELDNILRDIGEYELLNGLRPLRCGFRKTSSSVCKYYAC